MRHYPRILCAELTCRKPFLKVQAEMKFCGTGCKNKHHQRTQKRAMQAFQAIEEFRARAKRGSGMTILSRLAAEWNREDAEMIAAATARNAASEQPTSRRSPPEDPS